ncbi:MAG: cache domain-containing protein [Desulfobacterales bacterium]|nr:cache domain-containing protein [Desulfobacterales bacterium]
MKTRRIVKQFIYFCLLSFCLAAFAHAADKATKEECVLKSKEAADVVTNEGLDAALAQINDPNGPFVWKDTYVFAISLDEGKVIAHPIKPKLIGKMLTGLKDVNGKMFFVEFLNVAKEKGEGWVSYMWPKPGEKKPSPKNSYVYRVPGQNAVFLAGVYE